MAYAVVEFLRKVTVDDDVINRVEIAVVAYKWLFKGDGGVDKCWWPGSSYSSSKITKMAKLQMDVQDEKFDEFDVRILYSSDDYLKVRQKCRLAEYVSDIEGTETDYDEDHNRVKRKRKANNRYFDRDNETGQTAHSKKSCRPQSCVKKSTFRRRQSTLLNNATLSENEFQTNFLNELSKLNRKIADLTESLQTSFKGSLDVDDDNLTSEVPLMPVSDSFQFDVLNKFLEKSKSLKRKMINNLSTAGGRNLRETVYNIMPLIMTNKVADEYSFRGGKGKMNLSSYKGIVSVINKVVRRNPICNEYRNADIRHVIGEWLRHAEERDVGTALRKKRKEMKNRREVNGESATVISIPENHSDDQCYLPEDSPIVVTLE